VQTAVVAGHSPEIKATTGELERAVKALYKEIKTAKRKAPST